MKLFILIITLLSYSNLKSQALCVSAKVFGTDDHRLNGVTIQVIEDNKVVATQKTEKGMVWLYNCAYGKVYKFNYMYKGYLTRHLIFDLRNLPAEVSGENSSIDVDMTMYRKKELAGCKSQLPAWESMDSGVLVYDPLKSEFTWKCEEGITMKTEMEACRIH
ncbi:MAG TPA: hypothetical protein VD905_06070 [Flavobacteriales bacterium]|nr:hypothetical protein [Flavobacteriales bacterium]